MARWAQSLRSRDQIVLFAPTLDATICEDHPVRLFDEVLRQLDFTEWERRYFLLDGQPPIHPRVVAGVILYGLSLGIRASRKLEYACGNHIDFIWLTEGRVIDHSTIADFRVKFENELKAMFRQIGRVAIGMGMVNLNQVALDGTIKRSSNGRCAVATRATLEQKLAALDQRVEELLDQARQADQKEDELFGDSSPASLPRELSDLKARQKQLAAALKKVREAEAKQGKSKEAEAKSSDTKAPDAKAPDTKAPDAKAPDTKAPDAKAPDTKARDTKAPDKKESGKKAPAVPTTDPDSALMKNKTGGFAPNYLVVLATEGKNGLIMDCQVLGGDDEPSSVMPAMNNLKTAYGSQENSAGAQGNTQGDTGPDVHPVRQLLADTNFNTGQNLHQLQQAGIEPFMPQKKTGQVTGDLGLPVNPKTKAFDRDAFTYDPQTNAYQCPGKRTLPLAYYTTDQRQNGPVRYSVYECADCGGCSLAGQCLSGKNLRRTVRHDEHEPLRQEMNTRMKTEQGRAIYQRRSHLAETPFAVMNTVMNIRQLLLRGLDKAATELTWICSAYNLKKMTRLLASQRQMPAAG
jgi:transposase